MGAPAVWHAGGIADVEFSIYANHGGGYAYRLCRQDDPSDIVTEGCFEGGYLVRARRWADILCLVRHLPITYSPFHSRGFGTDANQPRCSSSGLTGRLSRTLPLFV